MRNLKQITKIIKPILKSHQVKRAAIFGSYARGEENKKSDLDLLIKFRYKNKSLFDLIDMQNQLEIAVKNKVDLVTEQCVSKYILPFIKKDKIEII